MAIGRVVQTGDRQLSGYAQHCQNYIHRPITLLSALVISPSTWVVVAGHIIINPEMHCCCDAVIFHRNGFAAVGRVHRDEIKLHKKCIRIEQCNRRAVTGKEFHYKSYLINYSNSLLILINCNK